MLNRVARAPQGLWVYVRHRAELLDFVPRRISAAPTK